MFQTKVTFNVFDMTFNSSMNGDFFYGHENQTNCNILHTAPKEISETFYSVTENKGCSDWDFIVLPIEQYR